MKTIFVIVLLMIAIVVGLALYAPEALPLSLQETLMSTSDQRTPEAVWHNASEELIVIDLLATDRVVSNPFVVSGKARGNWYFEASFPLHIVDAAGKTIVMMPVQAEGEWMTTEFVPFRAEVLLPADFRGAATLILQNDNASGLPEYDRSVSIPIIVE